MHREVDTHMHGTPRWIKLIIIAVVLIILLVVALAVSMSYVDRIYNSIPDHGSRTEVQSVLKHFRETKVSLHDIPVGWREGISSIPGYEVYRYDFLGCPLLAIHVVYDRHGRVKRIIPTYE